jgi:hypothetical protein
VEQVDEGENEHDDKFRRWFCDLSPSQRCQEVGIMHAEALSKEKVTPKEDIADWYNRKHPDRPPILQRRS